MGPSNRSLKATKLCRRAKEAAACAQGGKRDGGRERRKKEVESRGLACLFPLGSFALILRKLASRNRDSAAPSRRTGTFHRRDSEKERSLVSAEGKRAFEKKRKALFNLSVSPASSCSFSFVFLSVVRLALCRSSCSSRTCDSATATNKARASSSVARGRGGRRGGRRPGDMKAPGEGHREREKEKQQRSLALSL